MEWLLALNASLKYLEEHLEEKVDLAQAAHLADCSLYHYQRIFSYLSGMPLSEYLRRRRMTLAAQRLQMGEKVLQVSLRYGYESPTAFNRAFQSVHGVAPSEAKKEGVMLKAYPPIHFQISIKGVEQMEYRIEHKAAFRVIGCARKVASSLEENAQVVPQMWTQAAVSGMIAQLTKMMVTGEQSPSGLLGVCGACGEEWRYYIAVLVPQELPLPEGMEELTVPELDWAIFPGRGRMPEAITDLERRIITEWLPSSGYEYADGPDIEVYRTPNPQDAVFEVWLPVRRA